MASRLFLTLLALALLQVVSGAAILGFDGVDAPGGDIGTLGATSDMQCALACDKDSSCKAWAWSHGGNGCPSSNVCYKKLGNSSRSANPCVELGFKQGQPGVDRYGADLPGMPLTLNNTNAGASGCALACKQTAGCVAWSFDSCGGRLCWLKSSSTGASANTCRWSGVQGNMGQDMPFNDLPGSPITLPAYATTTDCAVLCDKTSGCTGWSFYLPGPNCETTNYCWLKGANPSLKQSYVAQSCRASLSLGTPTPAPTPSPIRAGVDQATYDNLVHYVKFCSITYPGNFNCAGYTLVSIINVTSVDTEGFIVRDDTRKEIIIVFRGSVSTRNWDTDYNGTSIPYTDYGCPGCWVHGGFYQAWNEASSFVMNTLKATANAYPSYSVVVCGHSLGGALTSFAAASVKAAGYKVAAYSYGQPAVGQSSFANWMDSTFPAANYYRGTHTNDGVPLMTPGNRHHGIEYWQNPDPSSSQTTKKCSGQEDPSCNMGAGGNGVNDAHQTYFGIGVWSHTCPP